MNPRTVAPDPRPVGEPRGPGPNGADSARRCFHELTGWFDWAQTRIRIDTPRPTARGAPRATSHSVQRFTLQLLCQTLTARFLKERGWVDPSILEPDPTPERPGPAGKPSGWLGDGPFDYYRRRLLPVFQRWSRLRLFAPDLGGSSAVAPNPARVVIPDEVFWASGEPGRLPRRGAGAVGQGLNRILSRYRFTLREPCASEAETAIDPSLLGLIVENLLDRLNSPAHGMAGSARKVTGAFYTPRRLIDAMVRLSLQHYLEAAITPHEPTAEEIGRLRAWCWGAPIERADSRLADWVLAALHGLRLIDPACGSGAFLVEALRRIEELLAQLEPQDRRNLARIQPGQGPGQTRRGCKARLIEQCVFGLDLEPLAVAIAEIRLLLSCLADIPAPRGEPHPACVPEDLPTCRDHLACGDALDAELPKAWDHLQFDLAIGNPPYGGAKVSEITRKTLNLGSRDPYGAFIARFLKNDGPAASLKEGGILAFVVSDTFLTLKTHRPLRAQLMTSRLHALVRLHPDTFPATVNAAILVVQKGGGPGSQPPTPEQLAEAWAREPQCRVADLIGVSIHENYDQFLTVMSHLKGDLQPPDPRPRDWAVYGYPQCLVATNRRLPFFVASPKLFGLFNDTTAPTGQVKIGRRHVEVRRITLNGRSLEVAKLGQLAEVRVGLQTGDNRSYLFKEPGARGAYRVITPRRRHLLLEADLDRIRHDPELRREVSLKGISRTDPRSQRYFGGRYIVPHDKGGESDAAAGWLPNYHVPTQYYIDWSEAAVDRMKTRRGRDGRPRSRFQNTSAYFVPGIAYSQTGVYCPTFRLNSAATFNTEATGIFSSLPPEALLAQLASKAAKYLIKNYIDNSIHASVDKLRELVLPLRVDAAAVRLVQTILRHQQTNPRYDYARHEQIEVDRLIYHAYGLNARDIQEVEDWYARRYPRLSAAQSAP